MSMAEIFDYNILKASLAAQRDAPDADCIRHDEYGRALYCYLLEYEHDGAMYCVDFWAYSEDDAKAHLLSMVAHMTYRGQKMAEVQA
jgi:hypothetical protein